MQGLMGIVTICLMDGSCISAVMTEFGTRDRIHFDSVSACEEAYRERHEGLAVVWMDMNGYFGSYMASVDCVPWAVGLEMIGEAHSL